MARTMRANMQAEQTLRAYTWTATGRAHLSLDGLTYLHDNAALTPGATPSDLRLGVAPTDTLVGIPAPDAVTGRPHMNLCYVCERDARKRVEAAGHVMPKRVASMAQTTRNGALKGAGTLVDVGEVTLRLTSRTKSPKRAPAITPPSESAGDLAALVARLDAVLAESRDITRAIAAMGAPAPQPTAAPAPKRESLHEVQTRLNAGSDLPAEERAPAPKREKPPVSDADVIQAAVRAWSANASKPKSDRNSAAYRAMCSARPGMPREQRESLWGTFKQARTA